MKMPTGVSFTPAVAEGTALFSLAAVEAAMYRSAVGGWVCEEKVVVTEDKKGQRIETATKWVPGCVRAQLFLARNLAPETWSDKPEEKRTKEGRGNLNVMLVKQCAEDVTAEVRDEV